MPAIRKGDAEVSLAEYVADMPDGCRVRREWEAMRAAVPFTLFGAWVFEFFWNDADPGDVEAADAQEKAVEFGLLKRTSEADSGATHAEDCEWQDDMPLDECCCYAPMLAPLALAAYKEAVK